MKICEQDILNVFVYICRPDSATLTALELDVGDTMQEAEQQNQPIPQEPEQPQEI